MITATGYLTSIANPHFSGLARIVFRSSKRTTPKTQYTTCYVEGGFGVRQIVAALGIQGTLTYASALRKVRYTIDDLGILASVELV